MSPFRARGERRVVPERPLVFHPCDHQIYIAADLVCSLACNRRSRIVNREEETGEERLSGGGIRTTRCVRRRRLRSRRSLFYSLPIHARARSYSIYDKTNRFSSARRDSFPSCWSFCTVLSSFSLSSLSLARTRRGTVHRFTVR